MTNVKQIKYNDLIEIIRAYNAVADKFIKKVNTGQAKSVETFNELRTTRLAAKKLGL